MGRIGEPEEIGDAAVWLCSDDASFVTGHRRRLREPVIDTVAGTDRP